MSEKNEIELLSDIAEKAPISARVNSFIVEQYKTSEIPVSLVVESSMIYFMKLKDADKIKFISENLAEKVKVKDIKKPQKVWKEMLNDYFKKLSVPDTITSALFSGLCIGAVALIGGMLTAMGDKIFEEK